MRKLLLSAVALLALSATNAFAINLTFQFDVNSSGPSIYACNAGIKHGSTPNVCFDRRDNSKLCTPGCAAGNMDACKQAPKDKYVEPKNCVCTGEFDSYGTQGTYRMDFLQATTADWADNQTAATKGIQTWVLTADKNATGQEFNQIFGSDKGLGNDFTTNFAYGKQIKDMTVNLGSEIYGAEYFVDICYRGPQIDYKHDGKVVDGLNFNLKAFATIFDIKKADDKSYDYLAGLKVRAEARCILDDDFNYCLADILPGETSGCGLNYDKATAWKSIADFRSISNGESVSKLINLTSIANDYNKTPRFCQIRYSFKETEITTMRKWKLQQARICTYTEITEPSAN